MLKFLALFKDTYMQTSAHLTYRAGYGTCDKRGQHSVAEVTEEIKNWEEKEETRCGQRS